VGVALGDGVIQQAFYAKYADTIDALDDVAWLPVAVRTEAQATYTQALKYVWWASVPLLVVGCLLSIALRRTVVMMEKS